MRIAFLFLLFLVAASAEIGGTEKKQEKFADKEFLVFNRNIVRLFRQIHTLNSNEDQRRIAREFRFESNFDKFTKIEVVKEFLDRLRMGMLPRNKIFSVTNGRQRDEVVSLFRVLYYARDFDTFYRVACWARDHVNEGMFVYAMTVAISQRMDTCLMVLPALFEIYPFYFINTEVIEKAHRLKMQERVFDPKLAEFFGVRQVDNTFYIRGNYSGWYTTTNEENALTYFTEDIALNSYYFYLHATYPFWLSTEEFKRDRRAVYLYTHQQLLARYYMERLSNNMGEIPRFMWDRPIRTGFKSSLRQFNGLEMPSRPNDFNLYTEHNLWDLTEVREYEIRIRDSIDRGFIITDEKPYSLRKPEDIERLSNIMMRINKDEDTSYHNLGTLTAKKLLGNGDDVCDDYRLNPTVLETYETALRDPMFYQLVQRFMHNVRRFKRYLRPYTRDEVSFDGVKIEDVRVDRLVTFFDTYDVDITNAVYRKGEETDKNRDMFTFKARQERLNHLPFDVKMEFTSDKSVDAVVRIFLGPKYDSMRRRIRFNDNRFNFFEMDRFVYKLKTGRNAVTRNSREFWSAAEDHVTVNDIFKRMDICITGTEQCLVDYKETHRGFPGRLLLPRGKRIGMEFYLYIVITPLRDTKVYGRRDTVLINREGRHVGNAITNIDDNAYGFPLDREIDKSTFWNSNMLLREVRIFHKADMSDNMTNRDRERIDIDRTDRNRLDMGRMDRDKMDRL